MILWFSYNIELFNEGSSAEQCSQRRCHQGAEGEQTMRFFQRDWLQRQIWGSRSPSWRTWVLAVERTTGTTTRKGGTKKEQKWSLETAAETNWLETGPGLFDNTSSVGSCQRPFFEIFGSSVGPLDSFTEVQQQPTNVIDYMFHYIPKETMDRWGSSLVKNRPVGETWCSTNYINGHSFSEENVHNFQPELGTSIFSSLGQLRLHSVRVTFI